jgi:dolichyl-phosphate-mannose--protein O-mannosyl transferase
VSVITWDKEQTTHKSAHRGSLQQGIFVILIAAIFLLRFSTEPFNTLFYDEAVNATLGREVLAGDFSQNATSWTFGSYLYPLLAGIAEQTAGETGLRFLSASLNTIAAVFVFFTAHRLFGMDAALWATALFGLAGGSISLGQLAVYDSLGLPLMAGALWAMVKSAFAKGNVRVRWLILAGVCFSLSVLSKYIGILFLPAIMLTGIMLYLSREDFSSLLPIFMVFLVIVMAILGTYGVLNFDALLSMMTNRNTLLFVASDRRAILETFIVEAGIVLPLGLTGLLLVGAAPFYRRRTGKLTGLLLLMLPVFFVSTLAAQIYQMFTQPCFLRRWPVLP